MKSVSSVDEKDRSMNFASSSQNLIKLVIDPIRAPNLNRYPVEMMKRNG